MEQEQAVENQVQVEDARSERSAYLRRFLMAKGIPLHKQVLMLSELFGTSRQTIFRKFKGEKEWTLSDLETIAARFGVSVEDLSQPIAAFAGEPAAVRIPRCPSQGKVAIGDKLEPGSISDLVAVKDADGGWEVYPRAMVPEGVDRWAVYALVLHSPLYIRVALLEDDASAAEALSEAFMDHGIQTTTFSTVETLIASIAEGRFQAFVLDWSMGRGESGEPLTAEPVLAEIRARDERLRVALKAGTTTMRATPIFITTGTLDGPNAGAVERVLIPASVRYKARVSVKPTRASLLAADIKRALGAPLGFPA